MMKYINEVMRFNLFYSFIKLIRLDFLLFFCHNIGMIDFKINDKVMHFREGLSLIKEIVDREGRNYYLIQILNNDNDVVYVPIDNALNIIRPITSKENALALIQYVKTIEPERISNTKQRRDSFKRRLGSGNIQDLAFLARQLYFFNHPEVIDVPVKLGPADVEMLKSATKTLYDELALSFSIDRDKIEDYIVQLLSK